jgi:pseudaminic acid cytidylyltransferase
VTGNIAIIPARGGSKRIPRKNIKEFGGKPIISWSIETAIKSNLFDRVIVSTDDDEIAKIAKNSGAEVPFLRPSELSNDYIGMTDVVSHAIYVLDLESQNFNSVCCISATAPFMSQSHLIESFNALKARGCNYVFSACSFSSNIFRSFAISSDGDVEMYFPENYEMRTQDLPEAYFDAAQFYWGTKEAWVEERMLFARDSSAVLIPRYLVHDIDTPEDWQNAEIFFKNFFKK